MVIFFTQRDLMTHIGLLWFLFLVGRICPLLMQERFLRPLLKRKAFYYGRLNKGSNFLQSTF